MKTLFLRSLATLAAGLVLACQASALTLTARQPNLQVAAGVPATAEFDIDFGTEPIEFMALQLDLEFAAVLLSADANAVTMSFAGVEPQFSLGQFVRANHDGGLIIAWSLQPTLTQALTLPSVSGKAVLSVPLTMVQAPSFTPMNAHLALWTLDDELNATASMDIVASAVPEPQAWMLALLGGCALVVMRRRSS